MTPARTPCRGYSLIEVLLVVVIVGILAMVGVSMLGNKPSAAVRAVMDELEGTISGAQKMAVATGRDVFLVSRGDWGGGTPMLIAYGYAADGQATILANGQSSSEAFHVAVGPGGALLREHMHAGVVTTTNSGWWGTAAGGSTNMDITAVAPFNSASTGFQGILGNSSQNLLQGGGSVASVRVSGANKRFTTTFWIEVVGLVDGQPQAGVPMGLLVVQANGAQVYKFYNPGTQNGSDGIWRRI